MEENRTVVPADSEAPAELGEQQPQPRTEEPVVDPGLPTMDMIEASEGEAGGADDPAVSSDDDTGRSSEPPADSSAAADETGASPYGSEQMTAEELLFATAVEAPAFHADWQLKAVIEAIIYVTEEPLSKQQIAASLQQPVEKVEQLLSELSADFEKPEHGIAIREVAGGYKMATKPEHHDAVRNFVKSLKPPLKLSLAALETLAVIAYKQPVTAPEIAEIRGVQGTGVLKTLLDRKLIAAAGRKNVIGKPILYKTTKDFLVQFGLKDLSELPSLKEFEEIRRMALSDETETPLAAAGAERMPVGDPPAAEPPAEPPPGEDEPPVKPPPSEEEPPIEPPPSEEEPAIEPPPGEQEPPKEAGQE